MSNWKILMPIAGVNWVLNPSAEKTGNFSTYNSSSVTRLTTVARFGDYSYFVNNTTTNAGLFLTLKALDNDIYWVTCYIYGTITGSMRASLNAASTFNTMAVIGGSTGGWVRYGVQIPAAQANASVTCHIISTANEDWYVDAIQVEKNIWTTYHDGNRGESVIYGENTGSLYRWAGARHASVSYRDAQERGGGRVMDLEDDYGLKVQQTPGAGMPPLISNTQGLSLQPGAAFKNTKVLPRQLTLVAETHNTSWAGYHSERKDLIDLMKPDGVRGSQPFLIGYAGANSGRIVWGRFRYADGLGIGDVSGGATFLENHIPLQLLAVSPFWIEDNRETATLGFYETLTGVNRVMARIDGVWQKLGTGFNGTSCFASAYDPTTGRVYFGGDFTTANGVTVNRICYWNPVTATFVAMDGGVGGVGKVVYDIAISPNGDVWVGGDFLTVGTAATAAVGLAKWDTEAQSWSVPTATATSFVSVRALLVNRRGTLYIGGDFATFGGAANTARIAAYSTAGAFSALGTGMDGAVYALAEGNVSSGATSTTKIFAGGSFTTGNGVTLTRVGLWNGTTFTAMGGGVNSTVRKLAVNRDGKVYVAGDFTASNTPAVTMNKIGIWNGNAWYPLGAGADNSIWAMDIGPDGMLYVGGEYTTIGPFTTHLPVKWNGSSWQLLDINSASTFDTAFTFTALPNGDLYVGSNSVVDMIIGSNTASASVASTNTAAVFPNFTLIGPTSGTLTLDSITNLSSNQTMYFDLVINLRERVLISLQPGNKRVSSDWSGIIPGMPLPHSDFANFHFLPARADGAVTNNIKAFCTGTVTGAVFLAHWIVVHWSADGAAA